MPQKNEFVKFRVELRTKKRYQAWRDRNETRFRNADEILNYLLDLAELIERERFPEIAKLRSY